MEKTNFWNDAAKWGAVMALVQIVFTTAGLFWRSSLLSLVSVVVFVVLLFFFTKRRVLLYGRGENGYGYGQCMKYIFWMMCFSGVLIGAWEIVARNVLFASRYETLLGESLKAMASLYSEAQLEMAVSMARTMFFSPIWVVVLSVLGAVVQGCFFGLFVSAFTKRDVVWVKHAEDSAERKDSSDE